jgi:hypothetical protein
MKRLLLLFGAIGLLACGISATKTPLPRTVAPAEVAAPTLAPTPATSARPAPTLVATPTTPVRPAPTPSGQRAASSAYLLESAIGQQPWTGQSHSLSYNLCSGVACRLMSAYGMYLPLLLR